LERGREILFVGRLVPDKGVDLLLEAIALLNARGPRPGVTIVGDGPERDRLERHCAAAGLSAQVAFLGSRAGAELRDLMNVHRVLAVPSRVEPFGIVALEGLACGCALVTSDAGGLPEAAGGCAIRFPSGSALGLAEALRAALDAGPVSAARRREHLARFSRNSVATRYIQAILETVVRRGTR
jgi:glycosyltransferase involved in cell wall biosynthesis